MLDSINTGKPDGVATYQLPIDMDLAAKVGFNGDDQCYVSLEFTRQFVGILIETMAFARSIGVSHISLSSCRGASFDFFDDEGLPHADATDACIESCRAVVMSGGEIVFEFPFGEPSVGAQISTRPVEIDEFMKMFQEYTSELLVGDMEENTHG